MLNSEKLAIAAHLHVLLRRKSGRVTDTEWMASNVEYATEIVNFARTKAEEEGHADLAEWAGKLEAAMALPQPKRPTIANLFHPSSTPLAVRKEPAAPAEGPSNSDTGLSRYIRGIR